MVKGAEREREREERVCVLCRPQPQGWPGAWPQTHNLSVVDQMYRQEDSAPEAATHRSTQQEEEYEEEDEEEEKKVNSSVKTFC